MTNQSNPPPIKFHGTVYLPAAENCLLDKSLHRYYCIGSYTFWSPVCFISLVDVCGFVWNHQWFWVSISTKSLTLHYSGQVMHPHHNREMERACMRRAISQTAKRYSGHHCSMMDCMFENPIAQPPLDLLGCCTYWHMHKANQIWRLGQQLVAAVIFTFNLLLACSTSYLPDFIWLRGNFFKVHSCSTS